MSGNEIAEIEEPHIPGNYSARKQNRWIPATAILPPTNSLLNRDDTSSPVLVAPSSPELSKVAQLAVPRQVHKDEDEIHKSVNQFHVSPAQMYSTESGKLYHAGSICLVLVGVPARGKTNLSISLCRYLRWLGVKANLFHMGDYRRERAKDVSNEFFDPKTESKEASRIRKELTSVVVNDMLSFFSNDNGQIAIYDAVNGVSSERIELAKRLSDQNIKVIFIESLIDDTDLLERNIADAAKSPDYLNWEKAEAIEDYKKRIEMVNHSYEEMSPNENLTYIKFINFGERLLVNKAQHDFLTTRIIFFLMNSKIKTGSIYFARCSNNKLSFKSDPALDSKGQAYSDKLSASLLKHIMDSKNLTDKKEVGKSLTVWTSTRQRTAQSAQVFRDIGIKTLHRPELTQLNPGDAEGLTEAELKEKFPSDYEAYKLDPYHQRFPRGESYHDLAVKFEPLILEIERMSNDILIIADETVIRVFYGYLMSSSCADIPFLRFPQNEIVKITYSAYANHAIRILIDGVQSD